MPRSATRETWWLLLLSCVCALVLWMTCIPEAFTIDDCNYLATVTPLRGGGLFVPGTEGLTPSAELVGFDPTARTRTVESTPVASTAPPLYGPVALPFSLLGWRGLVLVNALCFGLTACLVFGLTKACSRRAHAPWVGVGLFALGGYCLDYAQGMWPHMLSVALATAAVWLATRSYDDPRIPIPAVAGLLVGVAAGVRYQNIVFAVALGVTVMLWARRRWSSTLAYAAGLALPIVASASINAARLGSYNPISKGTHYIESSAGRAGFSRPADVLMSLWVRVVDYSAHPPFASEHGRASLPKEPGTGAFLVVGGLKKALLQSAPWAAVALVVLALAWTPRFSLSAGKRRQLRAMSVVVVAMLALFAWAGLERHDGWSFNQRYLLELVPLFAVATALVVDDWELDASSAIVGGALGVALALVPIVSVVPEHWFRQRALMSLPLAIAAVTLVVWWASCRWRRYHAARTAVLSAAVGWALAVHLGDDVQAARGLRDWHGFQRRAVAEQLPAGASAVMAGVGQKEALCRLQLDHDLVLVDPTADGGKDTSRLTGELLAAGRRVFVVGGLPDEVLRSIFEGRRMSLRATAPIPLAEVFEAAARRPDAAPPKPEP